MPTERQRVRARAVLAGPAFAPIVAALDARVSAEDLVEVVLDMIDAEPNRIVRLPEVLRLTGLSKSNLYRRIKAGTFPTPHGLGGTGFRPPVGWYLWEIRTWIASIG